MEQEEEAIHKLRVCIKRLRANFALVELASRNTYVAIHALGQLRPIFQSAGQIREAQINLSLARDCGKTPEYCTFLEKQIEKGHKKLAKSLKAFKQKKWRKNLAKARAAVNDMDEVEAQTALHNYLAEHRELVQDLNQNSISDKDLHKIRTVLKRFYEVQRFYLTDMLNDDILTARDALKTLNESLGDWHDKVVFEASMARFINRKLVGKSKERHTQVLTSIHRDVELQTKEIRNQLSAFLVSERLEQLIPPTE